MYAIYPATNFVAIVPSNTAKIQYDSRNVMARAIYVGVGGDIACRSADGTSVVFKDVPTGSVLPIATDQVFSTGTGATNLVALLDNNEQLN